MNELENRVKSQIVFYKQKVEDIKEQVKKHKEYSKEWLNEIDNLRLMSAKLEILEWLVG